MVHPVEVLTAYSHTFEVLSDHDLVRALADREAVVQGRDAIRDIITQRVARERT